MKHLLKRALPNSHTGIGILSITPVSYTHLKKMSSILNTENDVYILSGEGILGLEAACASLTEPGDKVLVIDNGIFGRGFDDFVKMYGGEVVYFSGDYTNEIDIEELEKFLQKENDFKYATVVHLSLIHI